MERKSQKPKGPELAPGNIHKEIKMLLDALNSRSERWVLDGTSEKSRNYTKTELLEKFLLLKDKNRREFVFDSLIGLKILEKGDPYYNSQTVQLVEPYVINIKVLKSFESKIKK